MSARTTISRRALALAALTAAAAAPAVAQAAPLDAPALGDLPTYSTGTVLGTYWTPAPGTFPPALSNPRWQIEAEDLSGPGVVAKTVGAPTTGTTLNLVNGHRYSVRVRALGDVCFDPPGPVTEICLPQIGPWSAADTTRMDNTNPSGTVTVNAGADYTTTRDVTLSLTGTDPLSNGLTASGVNQVQMGEDGSLPCTIIGPGDDSGCPVPFAATKPYQLKGAEGLRTVTVRVRDASRDTFTGPTIALGLQGNASAVVNDTIFLDTVAPTAQVAMSSPSVVQGAPVLFDGTASIDGTAGPADSGIDPASYVWTFGDGQTAAGATAAHAYAAPGTYTGDLTVKDKAGNTSSKPFQVTVSAPPAPGTPGGTTAGGTTAGGTTVAPVSLGRIVKTGNFRKLRSCSVRVRVSRRAVVRGDIRTGSGRVLRRAARTGGPGNVSLRLSCPRAGRYVVTVRAGSALRTLGVRVR